MDFGANKTPAEVIKDGEFGATYFRDIYSVIKEKWYKKSKKEFDQLKDMVQNYYSSNHYGASVNKCGVNVEHY